MRTAVVTRAVLRDCRHVVVAGTSTPLTSLARFPAFCVRLTDTAYTAKPSVLVHTRTCFCLHGNTYRIGSESLTFSRSSSSNNNTFEPPLLSRPCHTAYTSAVAATKPSLKGRTVRQLSMQSDMHSMQQQHLQCCSPQQTAQLPPVDAEALNETFTPLGAAQNAVLEAVAAGSPPAPGRPNCSSSTARMLTSSLAAVEAAGAATAAAAVGRKGVLRRQQRSQQQLSVDENRAYMLQLIADAEAEEAQAASATALLSEPAPAAPAVEAAVAASHLLNTTHSLMSGKRGSSRRGRRDAAHTSAAATAAPATPSSAGAPASPAAALAADEAAGGLGQPEDIESFKATMAALMSAAGGAVPQPTATAAATASASAAATAANAPAVTSTSSRRGKRKGAAGPAAATSAVGHAIAEQPQLPGPSAAALPGSLVVATAGFEAAFTPAAGDVEGEVTVEAAKPKRQRRARAAVDKPVAAAEGLADAPKRRRQRVKSTAAAAAAAAEGEAAGAEADTAAAAAAPLVKSHRKRRKSAAAANGDGSAADGAGSAAAAAAAKPVRRTKKVIAAEVAEEARLGTFGELTNLAGTYTHIAMFTNSSNSQHWQGLLLQSQQLSAPDLAAVAAAAATAAAPAGALNGLPGSGGGDATTAADVDSQQQQQQQQQSVGSAVHAKGNGGAGSSKESSSSPALCRVSGLGGFRQQVWLHSVPSGVAADDTHSSEPGKRVTAGNGLAPAAAAAAAGAFGSSRSSPAELKVLPNLGYACLCMTMRQYDVFNSRDCVKKTRDGPDGLAKVSQLALANARDLVPLIRWNEAHGIRLFRLSSCILPWMTSYRPEELPDWLHIQQALRAAGDLAKQLGHRLTFHPSEYCKIAGERPTWVTQSVGELEVHSRIFDEMGFLPASPYNKINIHVGGTYGGEKEATLRRFAKVVNERLSANCKARLTVENDDKASMYSVTDLQLVHQLTGIPIVFDFHHWKFCKGGQTQEEAFRSALATWPEGVRPVVHWSECPEDPDKRRSAHSEYVDGPINLFGLEGHVDVMIESKAKELALLEYRQAVMEGWEVRPRQRNSKFGDATAGPDLPADSESEEVGQEDGGDE